MTTIDLIKALPMEEDVRQDLLSNFDTLNIDQKFEVERAMWGAYDLLYEQLLQENFQKIWHELGEKNEKLDATFFKRVKDITEKQLDAEFQENADQTSIDEARKAMELIIKEMKAANMIGKTPAKKAD